MMNLAPSTHHQTVSRRLQFQLYQEIELTGRGQVFDAPVDLQLTDFDIVQPDLVIVISQNKIITPTRILGVPDLVVEILSASTRRYDLNDKRALFERCKVPEYWAVDMENATLIRHCLGRHQILSQPTCGRSRIQGGGSSDRLAAHLAVATLLRRIVV